MPASVCVAEYVFIMNKKRIGTCRLCMYGGPRHFQDTEPTTPGGRKIASLSEKQSNKLTGHYNARYFHTESRSKQKLTSRSAARPLPTPCAFVGVLTETNTISDSLTAEAISVVKNRFLVTQRSGVQCETTKHYYASRVDIGWSRQKVWLCKADKWSVKLILLRRWGKNDTRKHEELHELTSRESS